MTRRLAEIFERMSLPILIASLFLTGFLAYFLSGSLAFTTDLSSFAPETDADEAQERIEDSIGSSPHLVYITVKPSASEDQLANVLEMKALHRLQRTMRKSNLTLTRTGTSSRHKSMQLRFYRGSLMKGTTQEI